MKETMTIDKVIARPETIRIITKTGKVIIKPKAAPAKKRIVNNSLPKPDISK